MRCQIAGKNLTVVIERCVPGEREYVARATHFVERVLLADAALGRDEIGDFAGARANDRRGAVADVVAFVTRELGAIRLGDRKRAPHIVDRRLWHGANDRAGVRIMDGDRARSLDALAG